MALRMSLVALFALIGMAPAWADDQLVVVELFTSQGCSSCPPADALLGDLATRPDILALSRPVTYWDKQGWKDTLALPENTEKQRDYAEALGVGQVFTPQIVVNGAGQAVGSDKAAVTSLIAAAAAKPNSASLTLTQDGMGWHIRTQDIDGAKIHIIAYRPRAEVKIGAGENDGADIVYTNVVVSDEVFAKAGPAHNLFDIGALDTTGGLSYAVVAQHGDAGPVVAAAKIGDGAHAP